MNKQYKKIGCIADFSSKIAEEAYKKLIGQYNLYPIDDNSELISFDAIIVLGGDGFMLKSLHKFMKFHIPVYGMNRGSVGFLMNNYETENLLERLENAKTFILHPLEMKVKTLNNETKIELAVNEVSLLRETNQAAKIKISIDNKLMMETLVCDGILISTPAGSTAYNLAANGPIIPLGAKILAMTPISPFRPRRWRGALFSNKNEIHFKVLNFEKRPVSAVADFHEIRDVKAVIVKERRDISIPLLFDADNNIEERIIKEQFML